MDGSRDLAGVLYVRTDEGLELPVIDVTHPAFALSLTREQLEAVDEEQVRQMRAQPELSDQMRVMLAGSVIGKGLLGSAGGFLEAIPTYYLKVGSANVAAGANPVDRAIAGSAPATLVRQRLQDMARLMADGLMRALAEQPGAPVMFASIAGGVAAETWNALLYVRQEAEELLAGRVVVVRVLDMDGAAPVFGAKAMEALTAAGGRLGGMQISWEFVPYSWAKAEELGVHLTNAGAGEAVFVASSEGGLFEYGSDEEIVANLLAVHGATGPGAVVVGSVTRDCEQVRRTLERGGMALRPRALDEFRALADGAGWELDAVLERPGTFNVRLRKRVS